MARQHETVAVIGLGYVGLPLAVALGRVMPTIGFDVNSNRIESLRRGVDKNGEVAAHGLAAPYLHFTAEPAELSKADAYIVAVPTPTDKAKRPDLRFLISASQTVGEALQRRTKERENAPIPVVVFESTVYPGCTEDDCAPVIEKASGLKRSIDFKVGYSPERINPGDHEHTFETITKVVSGEDAETLDVVAQLYGRVVKAGIHRAPAIKVAEAAKVIENTQRDINIALMNELSIIFSKLGIDTKAVLEAAGTKWNFLRFTPGLVGGHCIPEDPYYLTHKAEEIGYHPQVILAGRRINDQMGAYVAHETIKLLARTGNVIQGARVLVLGVTFKENVPDVRNSRVMDLTRELETFGVHVEAFDPLVSEVAMKGLGVTVAKNPFAADTQGAGRYAAVVIAVNHATFPKATAAYSAMLSRTDQGVIVDVKGALDAAEFRNQGIAYWRL